MKFLSIILLTIAFSFVSAFSQFGLGKILQKKVEQKIEQKTEEAIDRALEGKSGDEDDIDATSESKTNTNSSASSSTSTTIAPAEIGTLSSFSKFDFIPGERIIFFDDFSQDDIGDFPAKWDTDGSGEVVTTNLYPGKWFKMLQGANYIPDVISPLPDNFTIEYDVLASFDLDKPNRYCGDFRIELASHKTGNRKFRPNDQEHYVYLQHKLQFKDKISSQIYSHSLGSENINNHVDGTWLENYHRKVYHISIAVNKTRVRYWINQTKVFDLPRILNKSAVLDYFILSLNWINTEQNYDVLVSNIKVAEGTVDTRSKLISEGKLVTNAITFNSGSDNIKPESYPTLKSIADALSSNPEVKIMIIGHTDSDGNADKNQTLSESRALSVKNSLVKEFNISESRIQTSGKGASNPITDNTTSDGKAQNRRVEFIKL